MFIIWWETFLSRRLSWFRVLFTNKYRLKIQNSYSPSKGSMAERYPCTIRIIMIVIIQSEFNKFLKFRQKSETVTSYCFRFFFKVRNTSNLWYSTWIYSAILQDFVGKKKSCIAIRNFTQIKEDISGASLRVAIRVWKPKDIKMHFILQTFFFSGYADDNPRDWWQKYVWAYCQFYTL